MVISGQTANPTSTQGYMKTTWKRRTLKDKLLGDDGAVQGEQHLIQFGLETEVRELPGERESSLGYARLPRESKLAAGIASSVLWQLLKTPEILRRNPYSIFYKASCQKQAGDNRRGAHIHICLPAHLQLAEEKKSHEIVQQINVSPPSLLPLHPTSPSISSLGSRLGIVQKCYGTHPNCNMHLIFFFKPL